MNNNYPSASEIIRNVADVKTGFEALYERGKFRVVRFEPPFFAGSEFWVVNEKGFLWEPAISLEAAKEYLETDEAREYDSC